MRTQPGVFRAPQYGLSRPSRQVREVTVVNTKRFTKEQLDELIKLEKVRQP